MHQRAPSARVVLDEELEESEEDEDPASLFAPGTGPDELATGDTGLVLTPPIRLRVAAFSFSSFSRRSTSRIFFDVPLSPGAGAAEYAESAQRELEEEAA